MCVFGSCLFRVPVQCSANGSVKVTSVGVATALASQVLPAALDSVGVATVDGGLLVCGLEEVTTAS